MGGVVLAASLAIVTTSIPDDPVGQPPPPALVTPSMVHPTPVPTDAIRDPVKNDAGWYALATAELAGLSPDAAPGSPLELWVTWTKPISKEPSVQKLLDGVTLERIVPPVTPDGPEVAVLNVSSKDIPDLIYGDRFGALSVVLQP